MADATAALFLDVRVGDAQAFEAALAPVIGQAHRLATGMLRDPAAAQDAVQEAAIKAWRKLDRLREGAELGPWFLGIVANECRTTLRSRWRRSVGSLDTARLAAPGRTGDVEQSQDVLSALAALRHSDRLVVVLHYWLDLPIDEVAAVVGASPSATKARLYRAVEKLRDRLGGEGRW
ncbi:MAG TPA: RNA polymerase sigma factor [Candidatus Angelobacter sp.]|nr:RNA polymerase sigma factor [Candidatus Angelobacter sp.]